MKTSENLIEKIQKLMAKAESAKNMGSTAEAEVFAAKVNEMLMKHNLSMMDVESYKTESPVIESEGVEYSKTKYNGGEWER